MGPRHQAEKTTTDLKGGWAWVRELIVSPPPELVRLQGLGLELVRLRGRNEKSVQSLTSPPPPCQGLSDPAQPPVLLDPTCLAWPKWKGLKASHGRPEGADPRRPHEKDPRGARGGLLHDLRAAGLSL